MGYKIVPRQIRLDLEHGILAILGLGKYHGMAKVLESRGLISKDNFGPYMMFTDKSVISNFMWPGLQNTRRGILKYWGPEW